MESQGINNPLISRENALPAGPRASRADSLHASAPPIPAHLELDYVVLHHTAIPTPHFDLLIQIPGRESLPTWRIPTSPDSWAQNPPPTRTIERLPDHRPLYMRYEGEISGGRGSVQRVRAGRCRTISTSPDGLILELLTPSCCRLLLPSGPQGDTPPPET
jgi:hypothetical protein